MSWSLELCATSDHCLHIQLLQESCSRAICCCSFAGVMKLAKPRIHSKLFWAWLATYSQHAQEMACFLVHLVTFGSCWRLVPRGSMDQWLSCPRKKPSTADERLHKFRLFFSCIHFLNHLKSLYQTKCASISMYHCGFATCHWTKVVSLVLCFIMTFGTVEYTTRRRRKTDVETDEAAKVPDVLMVLFRISDGVWDVKVQNELQ